MHKSTSPNFTRTTFFLSFVGLACAGLVYAATTAHTQGIANKPESHVELERPQERIFLNSFVRGRIFQKQSPGERTVEQVKKNIQVLAGMPDAQLIPVMNYFGASLGVKCDYCHVNKDGKWDFASDEKEHKATAREMIKMTLGVNKTFFKGNTEVACYTCHRGRTHPAGMPFPLPAAPVPSPTPAATVESKETPPTVDQILDKYTDALGGKATLEKLKTRAMKGTLLASNGTSLGYELYQVFPDKLFVVLHTPQQGTIERGLSGQVAWEKSSRGLRDLEGQELYFLQRYPGFFNDIKLKDQFTRLAFAGKEKIDDRDVYVLRGTTADNKRERLYFDVQSGLLLRRVSSTPTMLANIPEQVDFEDYREVDGMKLPFTIRVTSIDSSFSSTRKFTEIKLNTTVDEMKFKKPIS